MLTCVGGDVLLIWIKHHTNSFGIPGADRVIFIQEADIIFKHVNNRYIEEGGGKILGMKTNGKN